MPKKITLRDIASEAGVALSTVSQALNNKPNVSADMRQHILEVAEALGYRPKIELVAGDFSPLKTVGLITRSQPKDPLMINPFYSPIIAGAERECQIHNINLMYANLEVDKRNHATKLPAMIVDEMIDGLIIVGAFLEQTIVDMRRRTKRNIVLVDAYTSDDLVFDSVLIDNFNGAYTAVSYLIEKGHTHIGLIGSQPDAYPSILEREQGYLNALHQNNIAHTYIEPCDLERDDAFEATLRLLERAPHVTAIFGCNDNVAIGAMRAIQALGLSVPADVSVIGFDDIDLARAFVPALTTMYVDKSYMGQLAMRHLSDRRQYPERPTIKSLMSTRLIERDTVKDLNK